jgi:coatomer subunit beta
MEANCTLLLDLKGASPSVAELKEKLESANDEDKVVALKHIISAMLNGDPMRDMVMHVIRYAIITKHHVLKRLLMVYWECVEKRGPDGKLLPEMILVWYALATLFFLTIFTKCLISQKISAAMR